jgi:hypothetical protein
VISVPRPLPQAKASDVVEGAAERVQQNTSSDTIQNAAESVKKAAKAGDSAPMHGRTAIITGARLPQAHLPQICAADEILDQGATLHSVW